jgi:hypothetical protein
VSKKNWARAQKPDKGDEKRLYSDELRWPGASEESGCLKARVKSQSRRVRMEEAATQTSCSGIQNGGLCDILIRSPIQQDARGRDAHVGVRHTCATACAVACWNAAKTVPHRFGAARTLAG